MVLCIAMLEAKELHPACELNASGLVTDLLVDDGRLYAATYNGTVDIFDIATKKRTGQVSIPHIKDFMGDEIPAKIYSIDKIGDRLMMVSEGKSGYRNVFLYENGKVRQIIDHNAYLPIKKGLLVDRNHMLLGLLSSEIILYDIEAKKQLYRHTIKEEDLSGGSAFSDMVLDEARKTLATADESGDVNLFDVSNFRHLKLLTGQNVDNVYKIDYKKGVVITAGQDRRCAIYEPNGTAYYMKGKFLIYAAALTPSAKRGLFAATMENDLELFDVATRSVLAMLKGHDATLTDMAFVDEDHLFSSAEEKKILFWDLGSIH
jgi:hypothetical protein